MKFPVEKIKNVWKKFVGFLKKPRNVILLLLWAALLLQPVVITLLTKITFGQATRLMLFGPLSYTLWLIYLVITHAKLKRRRLAVFFAVPLLLMVPFLGFAVAGFFLKWGWLIAVTGVLFRITILATHLALFTGLFLWIRKRCRESETFFQALPFMLILFALIIGWIIVKTTPKPEKKRPQRTAYVVEVAPLKAGSQRVTLQATGTVTPAIGITLRARVAGEIIEVSPEFIDGGTFRQGEQILKIDPADYQLALEQKKAALAEAEFQLKLEEGQRDIAAREWELIVSDDESDDSDRELALRVPHLKYRAAKLEAAKAELEKAELDLARTDVRAPFNAVVVDRLTDLGTQATLQDSLATLAGFDVFYVRTSIPVDQLQWIECDPENGSPARVTRGMGDVRKGRVVRLESQIEEKGRMARVLIAIENPLQGESPVLLNEYVRVEIEGAPVEEAYRLPRAALHGDQFVWLATPMGALEIREVDVAWRDASSVIVTGGLNDGERLILTNLSTPINGMKLRVEGDPVSEQKGADNKKSGKGMKSNEK